MAQYQIKTGGKRLRALIPPLIFEAYGKNPLKAIPMGAALEIIHNATLVHDDLQDGDVLRRGLPTLWKKFGSAQAINCGDALFYFGIDLLNRLECEASKKNKGIALVLEATLSVIEGQAQEFLMKEEDFPGVKRYLSVIEKKTGALFELCFLLPLEILGRSQKEKKEVQNMARLWGILFQIRDDFLDLYGEKGRGHLGCDIEEGKISFFVASLNDIGSRKDRIALREILFLGGGQKNIQRALRLFEKYNLKEAALKKMASLESEIGRSELGRAMFDRLF